MKHVCDSTEAARQYAAAYATHYSDRRLPAALRMYQNVLTSFPDTPEAGYARMQIQNIINSVVPKQELQDAQLQLLLARLQLDRPSEADTCMVRQPALAQ